VKRGAGTAKAVPLQGMPSTLPIGWRSDTITNSYNYLILVSYPPAFPGIKLVYGSAIKEKQS
jgi:hypothetical protein